MLAMNAFVATFCLLGAWPSVATATCDGQASGACDADSTAQIQIAQMSSVKLPFPPASQCSPVFSGVDCSTSAAKGSCPLSELTYTLDMYFLDCWGNPETECDPESITTINGQTALIELPFLSPDACILNPASKDLNAKVIPKLVCLELSSDGGATVERVCYNTCGLSCQAGGCSDWDPSVNLNFCVASPDSSKEIIRFSIQWECYSPWSECLHPGGVGDPHMQTLAGQHYTLLEPGSYRFWSFSGLEAEISAQKKSPVDLRIYTHYAGKTSFTKGLILADFSSKTPRSMEITSKDCKWHSKVDTQWLTIDHQQMLNLPNAHGDHVTAFNVTRIGLPRTDIQLLMRKDDGFQKIATLHVLCRPGHHLDTKLHMSRSADLPFVQGQLGSHHEKASLLEVKGAQFKTMKDREFQVMEAWTSLGGSEEAQLYLKSVDRE